MIRERNVPCVNENDTRTVQLSRSNNVLIGHVPGQSQERRLACRFIENGAGLQCASSSLRKEKFLYRQSKSRMDPSAPKVVKM